MSIISDNKFSVANGYLKVAAPVEASQGKSAQEASVAPSATEVQQAKPNQAIASNLPQGEQISYNSSKLFGDLSLLEANDDGSYTFDKVNFSAKDAQTFNGLFNNLADELGNKGFLDYDDYAKQAASEGIVAAYADKKLNPQQGAVVKAAFNQMVADKRATAAQNTKLDNVTANPDKATAQYYGFAFKADQGTDAESIELSGQEQAREEFNRIDLKLVFQATDEKLKNAILKIFKNADYLSTESVMSAAKAYVQSMKPLVTHMEGDFASFDARDRGMTMYNFITKNMSGLTQNVDLMA